MSLADAIDFYDPHRLDALSAEELDRLPFGAIRVDAEGRILFYSRTQVDIANRPVESVLGRNFFSEIAPCTVVPEFYGRFRQGVLAGHLETTFEFVFDFEMQPVRVRIAMRNSERPGEFWILTKPLMSLPPRNERAAYDLISGKFCANFVTLSGSSFDFSQCDREPISTCGAIQPFGCLLVLAAEGDRILACSANTDMYLGVDAQTLLDAPLAQALPVASAPELHAAIQSGPSLSGLQSSFFHAQLPTSELPLAIQLHHWRGWRLLEIEPYGEMEMDRRLKGFDRAGYQRRLRGYNDIETLCRDVVEVLRQLTGFERVLVYRFESDDSGVVIAESLAPDTWPSVLGLRYPATDIPRQARALYRETPMRYAPSRDHSDIPLLSHSLTPDQIDIGIVQMRAQSPIHRNYLKRFGVNGSMSLSLIQDDRLWGLVIFHHRAPHPVTIGVRRWLIECIDLVSERIALIEERQRTRATQLGQMRVNAIIGDIDIERPFPESFIGKEDRLCELVEADWVQIYRHRQPVFDGQDLGLDAESQAVLLDFLSSRPGPIWSSDCLSGEFEPAAAYPDRLAGVLVIFADEQRENMLVFGRRRVTYTVNWGADPTSLPFAEDDRQQVLGWPNREFQVWREERTYHSLPWSDIALATALALKQLIQQVIVANAAYFERLAHTLAQQRDQIYRSHEEMRHRALHDALTGLPNRAYFREALSEAIAASAHSGRCFAVALMDIDHFKTINDTLGHDKGDLLLCAVAERIRAELPPNGLVARLGGDEFALLLPDAPDLETAYAQAEQVVAALRRTLLVGKDSFSITSSLGLTMGGPGAEPGELLKQADLALYRAKESGRNRASHFDANLESQALQRLAIDRAVLGRTPLEAIEILLQPQIPIAARSGIPRFEVLARWRTAEGRLIMPGDFIPAAERNGLITAVTKAIWQQALRCLRHRLDDSGREARLALNVTATDLEDQGFAHHLLQDLQAAALPPELIELEITESVLLRMTAGVKSSLFHLQQAGIQLALDDFGTGFSSMSYLRELPIASLKIDRDFIRGIESPSDHNLVAGLIALAHAIHKEVIAEGIETPHQLALLSEMGCDWGQGYLWSHPIPPEQAFATFG
ncbi:MAG: EAL domain-containing protein [Thermochromatium sp.]